MTDINQNDGTVSPAVLAQLFDCDESMIRYLAKKGIVIKSGHGKYIVSQSVRNYIRHLRGVAAGRGGEEKQITLTSERARYAKEQADAVALKNSILRGEMVDASSVQKKWASIFSAIRSGILAITSELPSLLVHLTRHDIEVIDRAIRDALNKVADDIGADQ